MKFKLIRQLETMQCGAACLAMICTALGMPVSLRRADRLCGASKQGVSMLAISKSASSLGLENATVKLTVERLSQMPLPCILHWDQNHFVVLYKISDNGRKFHIADPGKGKIVQAKADLEEHWISSNTGDEKKGIAMFFNPTETFFRMPKEEHETAHEFLRHT